VKAKKSEAKVKAKKSEAKAEAKKSQGKVKARKSESKAGSKKKKTREEGAPTQGPRRRAKGLSEHEKRLLAPYNNPPLSRKKMVVSSERD
jgi:hypothetical protein